MFTEVSLRSPTSPEPSLMNRGLLMSCLRGVGKPERLHEANETEI